MLCVHIKFEKFSLCNKKTRGSTRAFSEFLISNYFAAAYFFATTSQLITL